LHHVLSEESPDIVCITESWLKPTTTDSLILGCNLCNYTIFRKDRVDIQGGGVCIIIKNATIKAVRVVIDINYNEFDLVCIDMFSSCLPTRMIAGYRPPCSDTSAESVQYIKHFIACLPSLCNVDSSIVIIGDLNFPSIDWSNLKFVAENELCSTMF